MGKNKLRRAIETPRKILDFLLKRYARFFKDDKRFLSLRWWCCMRSKLDWDNPRTFNEKLQWLKLYNRQPLYTTLVDKVKVKEYVANIIGEEYIIPTLGVWERAEDIDFEKLPDKFVLKCNHNSGTGMCICTDKSKLDFDKVRQGLKRGLSENYFLVNREWPYKDVPRRILAEKYIEQTTERPLDDYKFFCFDGEPRYCQVIKDRTTQETIDFFDMDWNHQDFIGLNTQAVHAAMSIPRPETFERMKDIARKLSEGKPFTRVDLYEVDGKQYFGEVTLFPMSGFGHFTPNNIDEMMGEMLHLSKMGG